MVVERLRFSRYSAPPPFGYIDYNGFWGVDPQKRIKFQSSRAVRHSSFLFAVATIQRVDFFDIATSIKNAPMKPILSWVRSHYDILVLVLLAGILIQQYMLSSRIKHYAQTSKTQKYEEEREKFENTLDGHILVQNFIDAVFQKHKLGASHPRITNLGAAYNASDDYWIASGQIKWDVPAEHPFIHKYWKAGQTESTFIMHLRRYGTSFSWFREYLIIDGDVEGDDKNFF